MQGIITQGYGLTQQAIPTMGYGRVGLVDLSGTAAAVFNVEVSTVVRLRPLVATANGVFLVEIELERLRPLSGQADGVFDVEVSTLRRYMELSGQADGVFQVDISTVKSLVFLTGTANGVFDVQAIVKAIRNLSSEANGVFDVQIEVYSLGDWVHLDQIDFVGEQ